MTDLTAKARANLDSGAHDGPGTNVCRRCSGTKEPTRLNSAQCSRCARGTVNHAVKVPLPTDVFEALSADAARTGMNVAERIQFLLTRKYRKP